MFQGFYNLSSQMLTQNRNLNVISNNMANVSTAGFKSDTLITSNFRNEIVSRIGNKDKSPVAVGEMSDIRSVVSTVTDYSNCGYLPSESAFDMALTGNGFFVVQTPEGEVYTRDGSFSLDEEGYLVLPSIGRVMGENGPIAFDTDQFRVTPDGSIYRLEDDSLMGRLQVVDFPDYELDLLKSGNNVFTSVGAAPQPVQPQIQWKDLESSNVNAVEEMTSMMSSQRALQSAAQVLKMYDQLTGKIVSQLGPV